MKKIEVQEVPKTPVTVFPGVYLLNVAKQIIFMVLSYFEKLIKKFQKW